ncbi:MAG: hypothetical protein ACYTEQ_25705 [Planctomycetota bacterium]|jgi:hypothetical protein
MPTKAQLEEQLMEQHSDYAKMERKLLGRIYDLEEETARLTCDVEEARMYLRPFFVPLTAGPIPLDKGTAHCPVCNACAPGTLKMPPNGVAMVVTPRPIKHQGDCYFAEETPSEPPEPSMICNLTDPDGQKIVIDLRDIVIMMDSIPYTTIMVKEGVHVRRVAVCEKESVIRDLRTAGHKKEHVND